MDSVFVHAYLVLNGSLRNRTVPNTQPANPVALIQEWVESCEGVPTQACNHLGCFRGQCWVNLLLEECAVVQQRGNTFWYPAGFGMNNLGEKTNWDLCQMEYLLEKYWLSNMIKNKCWEWKFLLFTYFLHLNFFPFPLKSVFLNFSTFKIRGLQLPEFPWLTGEFWEKSAYLKTCQKLRNTALSF